MALLIETVDVNYSAGARMVVPGGAVFVKSGVTAYSNQGLVYGDAIGAGPSTLMVDGTVMTGGSTAVDFGFNGFIKVGLSGMIASTVDVSLALTTSNAAVVLHATGSALENRGTVSSNHVAVSLLGAGINVVNGGLISGNAFGIVGLAADAKLRNFGTIQSDGVGVSLTGATASAYLLNSGEIVSAGIGLQAMGGATDVVNKGRIFGNDHGIFSAGTTALHVANTGSIEAGEGLAAQFGNAADRLVNRGIIVGDVNLGGGDDVFDTRGGQIIGKVIGGDGGDTYYVSSDVEIVETSGGTGLDVINSAVDIYYAFADYFLEISNLVGTARVAIGGTSSDQINGNDLGNTLGGMAGNDSLNGNGGIDLISGGTGNDSLRGGEDDDVMDGGDGNDRLGGDAGDDVLRGRAGADRVDGGADDDRLLGDAGNDTVVGDSGDDILQGGKGSDVLYGGPDSDVFVFVSILDSTPGAGHDIIASDFSKVDDRIDLSGIDARALTAGNDAFAFIGTAAFANGTSGQLRYVALGLNIVVQGDVNGDAAADFEFQVNFETVITAASFVL